jgi:hypothetical protein
MHFWRPGFWTITVFAFSEHVRELRGELRGYCTGRAAPRQFPAVDMKYGAGMGTVVSRSTASVVRVVLASAALWLARFGCFGALAIQSDFHFKLGFR